MPALRKCFAALAVLALLCQLAFLASKERPDVETVAGITSGIEVAKPMTNQEIERLFVSIPNDTILRPKMRTFYHDIGMDNNNDIYNQLRLWKQAWTDAGWDARVLTIKDAERHPRYAELRARIENFDTCVNHMFHKVCFIRYLAAAADGDGWMADYDILPLHFEPITRLPNDGRFTSHDAYLVAPMNSATSGELIRVLELMISKVEEHNTKRTRGTVCEHDNTKFQITDQESLLIIKREINDRILPEETLIFPRTNLQETGLVVRAEDLISEMAETGHCFPDKKAMHFSARPNGLKRDDRFAYMLESWNKWKKACKS